MTRRDPDSEQITVELPEPPSFRLDGRRALVAGASSGIGLGCAAALAAAFLPGEWRRFPHVPVPAE